MEFKKYVDIERIKEKYTTNFITGETIVIEEKVDSANASIRYDNDTNSLIASSRRQFLNNDNTLNGFWNWVQTLNVDKFKEVIGDKYILFGEWTGMKHSISYPTDVSKNFYMFDVWDTENKQYLPIQETLNIFNKLSLFGLKKFVPIFYNGPFISWEHIMNFVGRSDIGASPCGEGIVIKRQDYLDSKSSRNPFYVKIVADQFAEVHNSKRAVDPEKLAQREKEMENVATVVTKRRVEKCLEKFVEDQLIPENWGAESMKQISKLLPKSVYEDCKKEEPDVVAANENFGKCCATLSMQYAREILNDKSKLF